MENLCTYKFNHDNVSVSGLSAFLAIILKSEYSHSYIIINVFNAPGWLGMFMQVISFTSLLIWFKEYNLNSDREKKPGDLEILSQIFLYLGKRFQFSRLIVKI